jgi:8-oxo-dGTP diphosphatase
VIKYKYERPALTVDCVVFGFDQADLKVLLIKRGLAPYKDTYALPGGFVRINETLEEAARRELEEETGLKKIFLEQLFTFGELNRDPRERVVTVAHYALVKLADHRTHAATDAAEARWFSVAKFPKLAFDHAHIINVAVERLKGKVRYQPIGFELLPPKFTLSEIQRLYETVLQQSLDKRNFRKKILSMDLLQELNEFQKGVAHRAARLYRFDERRYTQLKNKGFNFEI